MSRATSDDENCKTKEHPVERQVFALADEINERERNRKVSEGDQSIRENVEPEYAWVPEVTMPVRHERGGRKKVLKKFCHNECNASPLELNCGATLGERHRRVSCLRANRQVE